MRQTSTDVSGVIETKQSDVDESIIREKLESLLKKDNFKLWLITISKKSMNCFSLVSGKLLHLKITPQMVGFVVLCKNGMERTYQTCTEEDSTKFVKWCQSVNLYEQEDVTIDITPGKTVKFFCPI